MSFKRTRQHALLGAAIAVFISTAILPASALGRHEMRRAPQQSAASMTDSQPLLARIRAACPVLGDIVEELALQDLGEAFPRDGQKFRFREIAAAVAFAASGDTASLKHHARIAIDAGATTLDLGKLLYLTAVNAGGPSAIEATRVLAELISEPHDRCLDRATRVDSGQS